MSPEAAWTHRLFFFHHAPFWREYLHPLTKLFFGTGRPLLGPYESSLPCIAQILSSNFSSCGKFSNI